MLLPWLLSIVLCTDEVPFIESCQQPCEGRERPTHRSGTRPKAKISYQINVRCDLHVFIRGHCDFPARWTGPVCRNYLEQSLAALQRDVIVHNGASAYFNLDARE